MALVLNEWVFQDRVMNQDLFSKIIDLSQSNGYAIQSSWIGNVKGHIITMVSNSDKSYSTVDDYSILGISGDHLLERDVAHYRFVKIIFKFSAGSAVLNSYLSAKSYLG